MIYEPLFKLERTGVQIHYYTNIRKYNPVHWHSAVELIYILNGNAKIAIEGKDYPVVAGEFVVIDSNQLHEFRCRGESMMVVIHFSRSSMKNFIPNLDEYHFQCARAELQKEKLDAYLEICELLKGLPPLYVMHPTGYKLKSQAIAMEIFFELVNQFAETGEWVQKPEKRENLERMEEIIEYIELHHKELISLESIAAHFYLSREYFSRFFRKNMGVTFTRYVNQVRLMHIYQEICNTEFGIMELAEKHGCTPREIRMSRKRS